MEVKEKITPVAIEEEIQRSYIDYAMSVIVGRALPDVKDGLKPVQRRILYAMYQQGMFHNRPYKKCASIVGETMKTFHPHGDAAIYDALIRMGQDFSTRYPLIDGQGNFGSIDGDPPAAMRYTEARLSPIAEEMLADIEKNTVDFIPNYDNSTSEPKVLPTKIPNLLINGSQGIAVGMATSIPPHNLGEVVDALILLIDNPNASLDEIMEVLPGPDFPTGGIIVGVSGIKEAYATGKGKITVRALATVESSKSGKESIVITEIPYLVNKANLIESIARLVQEKKIEGISDLRDESDREGMRIVIELKKGEHAQVILNQLYKHVQLQDSFSIINLALVDGAPRYLSLIEMLNLFIEHRKEVVRRRTVFELEKAKHTAHILEGLKIALKNIDAIIELIKKSNSSEEAREQLMTKFSLTEIQANAILDMRLARLARLEREKITQEYKDIITRIEYLTAVLANPQLILEIIKQELKEIKEKHADERRTQILFEEPEEVTLDQLIKEENNVITISHAGYIKRIPLASYRLQKRGGKGVTGMVTKEEDFVEHLFIASTHAYILFFTDKGKVHWLRVYEIPQAERTSLGRAIVNLLPLAPDEKITASIPLNKFSALGSESLDNRFLIMVTQNGLIKKCDLAMFSRPRKGGIIALSLEEGDKLIDVELVSKGEEILLATKNGKAIRFSESEVRPMGRQAYGVRAIELEKDDIVIGMVHFPPETAPYNTLLTVTENGFGKRTPISEYRLQSRAGKGVINIRTDQRNGYVVGIKEVQDADELMIVTANGIVMRCAVAEIRTISRNTKGVRIIRLDPGDKVVSIATLPKNEE